MAYNDHNTEPLRAPRPQPRWSAPAPEHRWGGTVVSLVMLLGVFGAGAVWAHHQIQQADARARQHLDRNREAESRVADLRVLLLDALRTATSARSGVAFASRVDPIESGMGGVAGLLDEDERQTLATLWRRVKTAAQGLEDQRHSVAGQERRAWEAVLGAAHRLEHEVLPAVTELGPQFGPKMRLLSSIQAGVWHAAALGTNGTRAVRQQLEAQLAEFDSALAALRQLELTEAEVAPIERFEAAWRDTVSALQVVARGNNAADVAEHQLEQAAAALLPWIDEHLVNP